MQSRDANGTVKIIRESTLTWALELGGSVARWHPLRGPSVTPVWRIGHPLGELDTRPVET